MANYRAGLERPAKHLQITFMNPTDCLSRLADTIESRKPANGGDASSSYVARLLSRGPDAFLKKIGEEACEVVMAAKDLEHQPAQAALRANLVGEVADLWFHCLIALAHYDLTPAQVLAELDRRAGTSGIEEKALRKAEDRAIGERVIDKRAIENRIVENSKAAGD